MAFPSWRRIVVSAFAATAVSSVSMAGSAHAQSVLPETLAVITNYSHSNYLLPDDGAGGEGTYLQVYYAPNHPYNRTFTFEAVPGEPNTYRWRYAPTGRCLDAGAAAVGEFSVTHRTCNGSKTQWWYVREAGNSGRWVIRPYINENLAVTSTFGNDNWAPLRETPSRHVSTAAQQWFITEL